MYPVLFKIGSFTVYSYGFMLSMTFVVAAIALAQELKRKSMNEDLLGPTIILAVVFGLFGSKLFDVFEYWDRFLKDPVKVFLKGSGLTFLGGFLVAAVVITLYLALQRVSMLRFCDAACPGAMAGYGVARIGCQLSGDGDYGLPTTLPWGMAYPHGTVPTLEIVHPTPVYETLIAFTLAVILWRMRKRAAPDGWLFSFYLIFSGTERFLVEFIRVNPKWFLGLSQSQLISLTLATAGALYLVLTRNAPPADMHDGKGGLPARQPAPAS